MNCVHDLARRALAFAGGIDDTADAGVLPLRHRYAARLAGTAGPRTLTLARARCLEQAGSREAAIAAALLDEAARAWEPPARN